MGGGQRNTLRRTVRLPNEDVQPQQRRVGWDEGTARAGAAKGAFVGQRIGGELLGATMSEVGPGDRLSPYHTHYLNEEWVIVLRGEPTLRTPEGERVLKEGDVVCFPRGKDGAHQIINRTDSPIRVLMLSSMIRGEVIEYLDTGKVLAKDQEQKTSCLRGPDPRSSTGKARTSPGRHSRCDTRESVLAGVGGSVTFRRSSSLLGDVQFAKSSLRSLSVVPETEIVSSSKSTALASWREGAAKQAIFDFVARTCEGADAVPVEERVAVSTTTALLV